MKAYSMILGARRDGEGEKEGSSPGSDSIISPLNKESRSGDVK